MFLKPPTKWFLKYNQICKNPSKWYKYKATYNNNLEHHLTLYLPIQDDCVVHSIHEFCGCVLMSHYNDHTLLCWFRLCLFIQVIQGNLSINEFPYACIKKISTGHRYFNVKLYGFSLFFLVSVVMQQNIAILWTTYPKTVIVSL